MMVQTQGRTLDHAAIFYDFLSPIMTFGQEPRYCREIIESLELKGSERVLDIGCGTGQIAIRIAKALADKENSLVIGMDAAPNMIKVARKKARALGNARFDIGIAERLPYEDEYFDCVASGFFFHHINFSLKKEALHQMWRVLKRNGTAVIVDIDTPTNIFGKICSYCGYWLFKQDEILENIHGKLTEALNLSEFRSWYQASRHLGYISIFKLLK